MYTINICVCGPVIYRLFLLFILKSTFFIFFGCMNSSGTVGELRPGPAPEKEYQDVSSVSMHGQHPLFNGMPGIPISRNSIGIIDPDKTGYTVKEDYDGDGILNSEEIISNPFVADYPRIVTRLTTPVTMEIRINVNGTVETHSEMIEDTNVKNTISNSMEERQYSQLNEKTTPVGKNMSSSSNESLNSYGYSNEKYNELSVKASLSKKIPYIGKLSVSSEYNQHNKETETQRAEDKVMNSTGMERQVFEAVDYRDNLDRNGMEFTDETVESITRNSRTSKVLRKTESMGPNDGVVTTALFIKNISTNMPTEVSDVVCTLSFRTPHGTFLPVRTFTLKDEDFSDFSEVICGGEELGPYAITIDNLNTQMVMQALSKGYVPQVHIVSYKMDRVQDSPYYPPVENLKMVEEAAKARTATIKIVGPDKRELYRVAAFDVDETGDLSPGISLKKALFNVLHDRIGGSEEWQNDNNGDTLEIPDNLLGWKAYGESVFSYDYSETAKGNEWRNFETYIKEMEYVGTDLEGKPVKKIKKIETIRRINDLEKYNPFNLQDNPEYDRNSDMPQSEIDKMKFWVILHNGKYFQGDLNDPIWVGDRYEIIFVDVEDFNDHFGKSVYTPLLSNQLFKLNTRWNRLSEEDIFSRSYKIGKVSKGDVIKLEVQIDESRSLFSEMDSGREFGSKVSLNNIDGNFWHDFKYTFHDEDPTNTGKPESFLYTAWGSTNSIKFHINSSVNAHYYTIRFWDTTQSESEARIVKVTADELTKNFGYFTIHRETRLWEDDKKVGIISGDVSYNIKILAHGYSYNVPVTRIGFCNSNGGNMSTYSLAVTNTAVRPGNFTYSVEGSTNEMTVIIDESSFSELYRITVKGPCNYGNGNNPETAPLHSVNYAHAGNNLISVANPSLVSSSLNDDEKDLKVPGVYIVKVEALNSLSFSEDGDPLPENITLAQNEETSVNVHYERFINQRSYKPKKLEAILDARAVDLEVNFNDGSGWFKLALSHEDTEKNRIIDCRHTTYIEQAQRKVVVHFEAPGGLNSSMPSQYNVFHGGREEVEVSIRTVPRLQYRDTLWLKPNENGSYTMNGEQALYVNGSIENIINYDILHYWLQNEYSDATYFENVLNTRLFSHPGNISGIAVSDFSLIADNQEEFFFSPLKEHFYSISASITVKDLAVMAAEKTHVDNPSFRVNADTQGIIVSQVDSQYADHFKVWWREGRFKNSNQTFDSFDNWTELSEYLPEQNIFQDHRLVIDKALRTGVLNDLVPNTYYTVCMQAFCIDAEGVVTSASEKEFKTVKTLSFAVPMHKVQPYNVLYGFGYFHSDMSHLTNNLGNLLMHGVHYKYNLPLNSGFYDIFDTGTMGDMAAGKFIKIVEDGYNVTASAGLNLVPVAKRLFSESLSPPSGELWIDPVNMSFVLPRPVYWNRCESAGDFGCPQIGSIYSPDKEEKNKNITNQRIQTNYPNFKFGLGVELVFGGRALGDFMSYYITPFHINKPDLASGGLSFWFKVVGDLRTKDNNTHQHSKIIFRLTNSTYIVCKSDSYKAGSIEVYVGGILVNPPETYSVAIDSHAIHNLVVTWDFSDGGAGNLTVYVDNTEFYSGNGLAVSWEEIRDYKQNIELRLDCINGGSKMIYNSRTCIDNIKIWNGILNASDLANMEYNENMGRETALHPIYGGDLFHPVLSGDGNGVGFWYLPSGK